MKIVLICNEYPPRPHAGIGTFVATLARGLYGRGHRVTVVGLGAANEESDDGGIRVATLQRSRLRYVGNMISRIHLRRWLSAYVKAGQVDVIEVPDAEGLLPFGVDGCAVVIRLHQTFTGVELLARRRIAPGISFYERRTLISNSNWIGVSHHILGLTKTLFGVSPKRSVVVYSPIAPPPSHLPEMSGLPANYVLYAGHVCRRKGALVLAEAAREFMTPRPDLHLVYAGGILDEGSRPILEEIREVVGPKLSDRVRFLGHVEPESVLACMIRARIFALPTRIESFGLVVLEAMNCGLPVVFTKDPPGPEIVEDGVTGLLADPTSPRDFSEKITRLLDDPALAGRLAANARRVVAERFSVERCVEATERFYEECLKR